MPSIIEAVTDLPTRSQEIFHQVAQKKGFVPNVLAAYGGRPELLAGIAELSAAFGDGQLNEAEREIVYLTTSVVNKCRYCVAGHTYYALEAGIDHQTVNRLRQGLAIDDPGRDALRVFSQTLARTRGSFAAEAQARFRAQGFTRSQSLDVVVGVAAKTLSNMTASLLDLPLDDAFKPYIWSEREAM